MMRKRGILCRAPGLVGVGLLRAGVRGRGGVGAQAEGRRIAMSPRKVSDTSGSGCGIVAHGVV